MQRSIGSEWTLIDPVSFVSTGGATLTRLEDLSILASGASPETDTYIVRAYTAVQGITGVRLEVLSDPSLPGGGPGRQPEFYNFCLSELEIEAEPFVQEPEPISLQQATATFSQELGAEFFVGRAIDGNTDDGLGWGILPQIGDQTAVFETQEDIGFSEGTVLTFTIASLHRSTVSSGTHNLGRFRISVTADPRSEFADGQNTGGDVSANWTVLEPFFTMASGGTGLSVLSDNSVLASGNAPETEIYTISTTTDLQGITGIRLEALQHPSLPHNGPGRQDENGNFVVSEFTATAAPLGRQELELLAPLKDQVVAAGDTVTFEALVTSPEPVDYVWSFNGTPIPGEIGSTLVVSNVEPSEMGEYRVVMASNGQTLESAAVLRILSLERPVQLQQATATFSQTLGADFLVSRAIDGIINDGLGWGILPKIENQTAVFETASDLGFSNGTLISMSIACLHRSSVSGGTHNLGKFRISATTEPRNAFADGLTSDGDVDAEWVVLNPVSASAEGGTKLTILEDGSVLVAGPTPDSDTYYLSFRTSIANITGFRLEALQDPSLPNSGPGMQAANGNFVVSEFSVVATPLANGPRGAKQTAILCSLSSLSEPGLGGQ